METKILNQNPHNQNLLSEDLFLPIYQEIGEILLTKEGVQKIYQWKESTFKNQKSFPKNIGKVQVQDLLSSNESPKAINGCHQHALILKSVLDTYGFSTKLIETISKKGAYNRRHKHYSGHVLVKVLIDGRREFLDTTSKGSRFLKQDMKTSIIDNQRYPFLEGDTLKEMGIIDERSLYKFMIAAEKTMIKQNFTKRISDIFSFSS